MHPEDLNLYKYFRILRRYWLPGTFVWSLTIALAFLASFFDENVYQASGKLLLKKRDTTSALITKDSQTGLGTLEALSKGTPLDTEKSVLLSSPIIERTIEASSLTDESGQPHGYGAVISDLSVKNEPGTDILVITYEHEDPTKAKLFVDNLMAIYIDNNIRVNRAGATAARDFINKQLPQVESELIQAESALRQFKEANNLLNLNTQSEELINRTSNLDNRISIVQGELINLSGQVSALEAEAGISSENALFLNILNQENSGVQKVLNQLQAVQDQLVVQRAEFTDASPVVIELVNKQLALEAQLNNRIAETLGTSAAIAPPLLQASDLQKELASQLIGSEIRRQALVKELDFLLSERGLLQQQSQAIPQLEQQNKNLHRQLQLAQSAYETLSQSLQRVTLAENQDIENAEIISPAIVPLELASSSNKIYIILGFGAGAVLYVVTAFICYLLDPRFSSPEELSSFLQLPLLGEIPFGSGGIYPYDFDTPQDNDRPHFLKSSMLTYLDPDSVGAYRAARDEIIGLLTEREFKVFAVSSLLDGEGKSTIAANLAASISELGYRVLLIDAHPQQSSQSDIWRQPVEKGLTEILLKKLNWKDFVIRVHTDLEVLLEGYTTSESYLLWGSERMRYLIDDCRSSYDYVILDSPSIHQPTDVLNLGRMVDSILLISRLGTLNGSRALTLWKKLSGFRQDILGIIVNQSESQGQVLPDYMTDNNYQEKVLELH